MEQLEEQLPQWLKHTEGDQDKNGEITRLARKLKEHTTLAVMSAILRDMENWTTAKDKKKLKVVIERNIAKLEKRGASEAKSLRAYLKLREDTQALKAELERKIEELKKTDPKMAGEFRAILKRLFEKPQP
ncbi:unnamed protein product [marine sediment metagenome]|uniref:Uncharacterized protein n=1 Tax=marine sediment metagenome TaxID=412755 RepID=X1CVF6_9ZZZZ